MMSSIREVGYAVRGTGLPVCKNIRMEARGEKFPAVFNYCPRNLLAKLCREVLFDGGHIWCVKCLKQLDKFIVEVEVVSKQRPRQCSVCQYL